MHLWVCWFWHAKQAAHLCSRLPPLSVDLLLHCKTDCHWGPCLRLSLQLHAHRGSLCLRLSRFLHNTGICGSNAVGKCPLLDSDLHVRWRCQLIVRLPLQVAPQLEIGPVCLAEAPHAPPCPAAAAAADAGSCCASRLARKHSCSPPGHVYEAKCPPSCSSRLTLIWMCCWKATYSVSSCCCSWCWGCSGLYALSLRATSTQVDELGTQVESV